MSDRAPAELTDRERLVAMIEAGATPSVIAWSLNLSEKSVRAEIAQMKAATKAAIAPVVVAEVAVERVDAAPVAEAPAPIAAPAIAVEPHARWYGERVERLRALAADGLSASQIAAQMDVTRNAVIGAALRFGIEMGRGRRPSPAPKEPAPHVEPPPPAPKSAPLALVVAAPAITPSSPKLSPAKARPALARGPVALVDLTSAQCHFPLWDEADEPKFYCGAPVRAPGDSWCAACAKKVFSTAGLAALDRRRAAGEGRRSAAGRAA